MSREYLTNAVKAEYLPALDQTRIVVHLDGNVPVERGDALTVTTKESR